MSGSAPSPLPPPTSRASSSSSESNDDSMAAVSLSPLTPRHGDGHHRQSRVPERSLRKRGTTTAAPSQPSPAPIIPQDEDDSLSNSEEDQTKSGDTSSILRSVLGASPFLMGPHIFSTSEVLQPPRARKETVKNDVQKNLDITLTSKQNSLHRRIARQSPLMTPASSLESPYSDIDIEGGESDELGPLASWQQRNSYQKNYAFVLRSRENIIIHFLAELRMLKTDYPFILSATFVTAFQSSFTNIAYWQHAQLNAANRVPLKDIAFEILPALDGKMWIVSEYICWFIVGSSVACIISNLIVKWNAPHGRPIYNVQILRRMGMTVACCQILRTVSFLVTTLPGASRQCRYTVPDGLTSAAMLDGPAPDEGNPPGYAPPTDLYDIIFRFDSTNGCGDLMFSSHTIFTMTFVCLIFKYFNFKWLKLTMVLCQILIVPFILAARKHYTVDVFTALYVTPLVFEILWTRFPDRDTSIDLAKYYGIRFYLAPGNHDSFSYVVGLWGREYFIDPDELPVDIVQGKHHTNSLASQWEKGGEGTRTTASVV